MEDQKENPLFINGTFEELVKELVTPEKKAAVIYESLMAKLNEVTKQFDAVVEEYKIQEGIRIEVFNGKCLCAIDFGALTIPQLITPQKEGEQPPQ